ncbi:MAG: DUF411 domain-containing protein [Rhodobacteraceae bacterium]|jgi:hypothetical protein|nr:DUF411 domain-containing protein [Paracoccaceae bacterium]
MTCPPLTRRHLLRGTAALLVLPALPALAETAPPPIHVLKDPACGCCSAWIAVLDADGFSVTVEDRAAEQLARDKRDRGIPEAMVSCHTAQIDGYVIEGHVPPADIRRLLAGRPAALGLAVPGMPFGSPGMGPETEREAYDVFLIHRDGTTAVFASYPAA